jgi:cephalosporin hydroxylase
MDTGIEDAPDNHFPNKPWGKGNNPKTAVFEFLKNNKEFFADTEIDGKLQVTVAPSGYLKKFR